MASIIIENVGPNTLLDIPLPDEGGVTVLRGRNDKGKSEGLKAVRALAGGKERLSVRKDAPPGTKGKVTGGGVTLTVSKSTRRKGVAEFEVGDGDFDVEDVVDPGIKDPVAADAKRIKGLLSIANAAISPSEFYDICGGKEAFVEAVGDSCAFDPLTAAAKVRQYLQLQAREAAEEAAALANRAAGLREAVAGVDLKGEADPEKLQLNFEAALACHARIEERLQEANRARNAHENALAELEDAKAEYDGPTMADAEQARDQATTMVSEQQSEVNLLEHQLDVARKELETRKGVQAAAGERYNHAAQHDRTIKRLEGIIAKGAPDAALTQGDVEDAAKELEAARAALHNGHKIRDAQDNIDKAVECEEKSRERTADETGWRERLTKVPEILSAAVKGLGTELDVYNDRLIIVRDGVPKFFDELSYGARRKVALDIRIDHMPANGLLDLKQEAWESLDPIARREITEHLKSRRVCMITAACSADETVTAHVYEPEEAAV